MILPRSSVVSGGTRDDDHHADRVSRRALLQLMPTFTTVATTGAAASGDYKYSGAAAVGDKVIFAPLNQNNVGVLDTTTNVFSTVATTGAAASGSNKYSGAAAVGVKVYFAPLNQNNVGVLDTTTNVFTTVATTGAAASGGDKYSGAAAVGDVVCFTPRRQNNVGVLDTTTNVFTTIATTGDAASGSHKYWGAAAVGDKVYFAPGIQNNVGVLDTTTNTFTTIATTGDAASGSHKYMGAAAMGSNVYFAPDWQNNVGVLDTTTNVFTTIATTGAAASGNYKYNRAAAVGDVVYFAPAIQNNVGVLDTTTNVFTTIATTGAAASGDRKYNGAAAVGDKVYLAPFNQNNVGVLATYKVLPAASSDATLTMMYTEATSGSSYYGHMVPPFDGRNESIGTSSAVYKSSLPYGYTTIQLRPLAASPKVYKIVISATDPATSFGTSDGNRTVTSNSTLAYSMPTTKSQSWVNRGAMSPARTFAANSTNFTVTVTAEDRVTTRTYYFEVTRLDVSTNTQLSQLNVLDVDSSATYPKSGVFTYDFVKTTTDYFLELENNFATIRLQPWTYDAGSTVTVGTGCPPWDGACGTNVTSAAITNGTASSAVALIAGANMTVRILVTSESHVGDSFPPNPDTPSRVFHNIVIFRRQKSNAVTLSGVYLKWRNVYSNVTTTDISFPLTPTFTAGTLSYTATVAHNVS
jgi:hypothetical protein